MLRLRFFSLVFLFVFLLSIPLYADEPVLADIDPNYVPENPMVEIRYDDGVPRRDDPGPDWIFYDDNNPRSLYTTENLWSRVRFTPNAEFQLIGVRVLPLNQGHNPDAPCDILVYRENQDNHNLTDLAWEGTIEELLPWGQGWNWIEIEDEDERPVFEAGEHFSIIYGPAPGGAYNNPQQGDGWWNLFDGATEVRRSFMLAGEVQNDHGRWSAINGGDLLIRANGEYQGDFIDLQVLSVYNAEDSLARRWMTLPEMEKSFFAEIVNNGDDFEEEFFVTFEVINFDGEQVFECEEAVEGIEAEDTLVVECQENWEVPFEVGYYEVVVTVDAEGDADGENNVLGLEQIVYDQEASRDVWLGFIDDELEGSTQWNESSGWAVRFDHPGTETPLWITEFRAGINGANNIECPFQIVVMDIESGEFAIEWQGVGNPDGQGWCTVELEEDDYVTFHEGEALMVSYFFVNGGNFRSDNTPPIAGTNLKMPAAMMQTRNDGESYSHAWSGDYAIQAKISGPDHGGYLHGWVADEETDEPIAEVLIETSQEHRGYTDEEGHFIFRYGPQGDFSLTASKLGYNTMTMDDLHLEEDDTLEVELSLTHPEFVPSDDNITIETGLDGEEEFNLTVENSGNGPLTYSVARRLIEEAEIEPYILRESIMAGETVEDTRLEGVLLIDDRYYISGAHDRNPVLYVLDSEGNEIDQIEQPGEDNRGMRDLAWDGELIWGGIGEMIYGITLDGEVVHSFESPVNPTTCITYDPGNDLLWCAATTSDVVAVNRDGEEIAEIDRQDLRMYGFGWWANDPDGYNLYIHNLDRETDMPVIHKCNVENGDMTFVAEIVTELGGSPSGISITNQYDRCSWNILAMSNASNDEGGDRLDCWQLAPRLDWFAVDPMAGEVEAGDEQRFTVSFNAAGYDFAAYEGRLVFTHNAEGGETIIPVTLDIVEGPVHAQRMLELGVGWNMVSVNLQPDEEDIVELTQGLVEDNLLLMMKNGMGQFYNPEFNFNNIPGWFVDEGYLIKMRAAGQLTLEGMTVMADTPLELIDGWQMISYYPRVPVDAVIALAGLGDQLLMAKDGLGRFYNPEWDFSNMGRMSEGNGYLVKLDGDAELVYRLRAEEDEAAAVQSRNLPLQYLPEAKNTGSNMSLLVISNGGLQGEIGVYTGEEFVGSGVLNGARCGIAVWGDDPTTEKIDGALKGQELSLILHTGEESIPVGYTTLAGDGKYQTDSFLAVELGDAPLQPVEFGIESAHPNPFNSSTVVKFGLVESADISLAVYDLHGRIVKDILTGHKSAGVHQVSFEAGTLPSGVYMLNLKAGEQVSRWKVVLLR